MPRVLCLQRLLATGTRSSLYYLAIFCLMLLVVLAYSLNSGLFDSLTFCETPALNKYFSDDALVLGDLKIDNMTRAGIIGSIPLKGDTRVPGDTVSEIDRHVTRATSSAHNLGIKYYPDDKATDYPLSVLPDPYIIRNANICKSLTHLKIVVIVTSATTNFNQRRTIRRTWGNLSYYKKDAVRVVFMLADPNFEITQERIERENKQFKDIVQGKFLDTYKNLTHKTVLGLRWVSEHCMNSKMVVKVDDDVVLNLFKIFHMMNTGKCCKEPMEITCHVRPVGDSAIFREGADNKWIVDDGYFENYKVYPVPYCDGMFTLSDINVIPVLYKAATHMPFFWIEDVYMTGLLASEAGNVKLRTVPGVWSYGDYGLYCLKKVWGDCFFFAGISGNLGKFNRMWSLLLEMEQ